MDNHLEILVLDANQRSALAVTRSLGRQLNLSVTTADSTRSSLAGSSKYSSNYFQSPDPTVEPERYLEWLQKLLEDRNFDLVIPVTEVTSQLLLANRDRFKKLELPFAGYETVMSLANKANLLKFAEIAGVAYPESQLVTDYRELDSKLCRYPIVVKPTLSKIYSQGRWISTKVEVVRSSDELEDLILRTEYLRSHPFLLQQFIDGYGAGVFTIYNNSSPLAFFAHQRIREKPPTGGVSVLSQSIELDPELKRLADRLLKAANWHGVAMVEYRICKKSLKPYLMEVNTRFWGSLQLAIDSGVDFPLLLLKTHLRQPIEPIESYKIGNQLRWFLGDLDSLYIYLKGDYSMKEKLKRLATFFKPNFKNRRHEVDRLEDMGPALYELSNYIRTTFHIGGELNERSD